MPHPGGPAQWLVNIRPRLRAFVACVACTLSAAACGEDSAESLVRDLRGGTVAERRRAAGRLMDDAVHASFAIPALIAALRDPDYSVRSFAARALGAIGRPARAAAEPLLDLLMTEDAPLTRHFAVESIGLIQPESTEVADAVVNALVSRRIYWDEARGALGRMGSWGADAHRRIGSPALMARLVRDNQDASALEKLEELGSGASEAASTLAEIIQRPEVSPEQRDKVARALGEIGSRSEGVIRALEAAAAAGSADASHALLKVRRK